MSALAPAASAPPAVLPAVLPELPPGLSAALWRGCDLGVAAGRVVSSGFAALDGELPGGGWPSRGLTEVLCAQPGVLEWRLLGGALRQVVAAGQSVVIVGPPRHPHLPGLQHEGLDARRLVWIRAEAPSERLWCTELLLKSASSGAVVAWLPQARPEQVRRLQVCAQSCDGPVFLCRPLAARHEPSAAPLRVLASLGPDWSLQVQLLKRRGAAHEGVLQLPSVPGGLAAVLTPRLMAPSRLVHDRLTDRGVHAALGRIAPARRSPARAH